MEQQSIAQLEARIRREYGNLTGLVVLQDGETRYEQYFQGCTAASRIHVYSVTKSIVSILIGIALDKGCLKNIDQKVLDFFPEYPVRKGEQTIQKITLGHLLTMTAPYRYRLAPYVKYFTSDDPVTFTLDQLGGRGRIGKFRYTPLIGPDLLTGILTRVTGRTVLEFAEEHLLAPLGIHVTGSMVFQSKEEQLAFNRATDVSGWVADPTGVNTGGWGLTLAPMDLAKIGQLYLQGGVWEGRQLVPQQWIDASTKEHSRWEKQGLAYGYLWWVLNERDHVFAAMGDGGNVLYVNGRKKLVVASTSLFAPRAKDRIELIQQYIEPLWGGND